MVKRRKMLIGLGALAAGGAAATGTGAFSAASMDREGNVDVVADDQGLLALAPGDSIGSDIVRLSSNPGELVIDFTADGAAGGVNVDSRYQVGDFMFSTPGEVDAIDSAGRWITDPAFTITNNDTVTHEVTLDYVVEESIGGSQIYIQSQTESKDFRESVAHQLKGPSGRRQNPNTHEVDSGDSILVSLQVDSGDGNSSFADTDGSISDDLSGTLNIDGT